MVIAPLTYSPCAASLERGISQACGRPDRGRKAVTAVFSVRFRIVFREFSDPSVSPSPQPGGGAQVAVDKQTGYFSLIADKLLLKIKRKVCTIVSRALRARMVTKDSMRFC